MRRYKHTTQHPNKLQRAIRGQDISKIMAKLGEIIQTINIAILLLMILVVITQCQPVEASNKIGNKPLFYATKQAIRGNYQKACIPCQSRGWSVQQTSTHATEFVQNAPKNAPKKK